MERCQDAGCGFENRAEYCEQRIREPDGDGPVIIDLLETLLYENEQVSNHRYSMAVTDRMMRLERGFTVLHSDLETGIWPLTETSFTVSHELDKRSGVNVYEVAVSWAVRHNEATPSDLFTVTYTLHRYANGTVNGTVEQRDIQDGSYRETPLTPYDYSQLFDAMNLVDRSQSAERADNARALPA